MREILFKAKRVDNGEWVEGDLVQNARTQDGYSALKPATIRSSEWFYPKEVDSETVCQFTGLLDKNGKRIFEGDILNTEHWKSHEIHIGYYELYAGGVIRNCINVGPAVLTTTTKDTNTVDCEIIGNIHDKEKQNENS